MKEEQNEKITRKIERVCTWARFCKDGNFVFPATLCISVGKREKERERKGKESNTSVLFADDEVTSQQVLVESALRENSTQNVGFAGRTCDRSIFAKIAYERGGW